MKKEHLCLLLALTFTEIVAAATPTQRIYPDKKLTPGVVDPSCTAATIQKPGYTATVRDVPESVKKQVMIEYGLDPKDSGKYEIDHFISLENCGSNDIKNLWPQPYCIPGNDPMKSGCWGAREKDKVETELSHWVRKGQMPLATDQAILRKDWIACYKQIATGKMCTL
jgi:hypothetical protein